ncbi:unnamed protein product [Mytilus coruscus]|uniref:UspA domain-containing protein n=1 Tax=Mytilus coruscus TaxID=42192 RepID=A0A6J8E4B7_MYTCO|nr:unnamed protein product [Mytilus coruscus]
MDTVEKKQRICILAVDGSKHSDLALKWYTENVHKSGDKVLLTHCVDHRKHLTYGSVSMVPGNPDSITHAFAAEEKKAKELMEKYVADCKKLGLHDVDLVKVIGEPGDGIIKAAEEKKADMIITGCRGLGQIRRTMVGSVSDYILHHSHVPVFVCRH